MKNWIWGLSLLVVSLGAIFYRAHLNSDQALQSWNGTEPVAEALQQACRLAKKEDSQCRDSILETIVWRFPYLPLCRLHSNQASCEARLAELSVFRFDENCVKSLETDSTQKSCRRRHYQAQIFLEDQDFASLLISQAPAELQDELRQSFARVKGATADCEGLDETLRALCLSRPAWRKDPRDCSQVLDLGWRLRCEASQPLSTPQDCAKAISPANCLMNVWWTSTNPEALSCDPYVDTLKPLCYFVQSFSKNLLKMAREHLPLRALRLPQNRPTLPTAAPSSTPPKWVPVDHPEIEIQGFKLEPRRAPVGQFVLEPAKLRGLENPPVSAFDTRVGGLKPLRLEADDLNQDGWVDVVVSGPSEIAIYWNLEGRFQKQPLALSLLKANLQTRSPLVADLDQDGWKDLAFLVPGFRLDVLWGSPQGFQESTQLPLKQVPTFAELELPRRRTPEVSELILNWHSDRETRPGDQLLIQISKDRQLSLAQEKTPLSTGSFPDFPDSLPKPVPEAKLKWAPLTAKIQDLVWVEFSQQQPQSKNVVCENKLNLQSELTCQTYSKLRESLTTFKPRLCEESLFDSNEKNYLCPALMRVELAKRWALPALCEDLRQLHPEIWQNCLEDVHRMVFHPTRRLEAPFTSRLYQKRGRTWIDRTTELGLENLADVEKSFFEDFDNDGRVDLFTLGWNTVYEQARPRFLWNHSSGRFIDYSEFWWNEQASVYPQDAVAADFDNDGDVDLIWRAPLNQLYFLENRLHSGQSLRLEFPELIQRPGATVELFGNEGTLQTRWLAKDNWVVFGIDKDFHAEGVRLTWPDGTGWEFKWPLQSGHHYRLRKKP